MLKPSEITPRSADVASAFSSLAFDHLFFTGSTRVGRLVMRAAAANLTPVTLELGGKSPAIIHDSYPLLRAVDRIITGKLLNAASRQPRTFYVCSCGLEKAGNNPFSQGPPELAGTSGCPDGTA